MKKLFFLVLVTIFVTNTDAQLCSNCQTEKKVGAQSPAFIPAIFTPVPIGSSGEGTAYLKMVPVGYQRYLLAYIYMLDANGKIIEIPISMDMMTYKPGNWSGRFHHNYTLDKTNPDAAWYNTPEPVRFRIEVMPAGSNIGGQPITDQNGNVYAIQRITFLG